MIKVLSHLRGETVPRRCGEVAAFTFVELMLVAILIGVLATLSVPMFRRTFQDLQLGNTSQNMATLCRYANQKAIIERSVYRLNLEPRRGKFWLTQCALGPSSGEDFKRLGGRLGKVYSVPAGITLECQVKNIAFYPDGSADKASIQLTNLNKKSLVLTTEKSRGYIKVIEADEK